MEYPDHQVGSVCRLYLKNFMQYAECEMRPGPTLNVVIGPNGAGKSSVVNGLALALGSKTAVLGRADSVVDFIRTGCHESELLVELKGEEGKENVCIGRKWGRDGKTLWTLNRKRSSQKEVVTLVRQMNIQTDNLCQFLPQDKVHDFSKMNAKELLHKTIEAVGAQGLRNDHDQLKGMQDDLKNKTDRFHHKENTLAQVSNRLQTLEGHVKHFEEKKKIEEQMEVLRKREAWADVEESIANIRNARKRRDAMAKKVKEAEEALGPLVADIEAQVGRRNGLEAGVKTDTEASRDCFNKAGTKNRRFHTLNEEMETLDEQLTEAHERVKEREAHIQKLDKAIKDLKRQYQEESQASAAAEGADSAEKMAAQVSALNTQIGQMQRELGQLVNMNTEDNYEKNALEQRILRSRETQAQLLNVDEQKKDIMRTMPQGEDTLKALHWLEANLDKFKGQVFTPIMLQVDVKEAERNAPFLENCIPAKDLVAFAADNADDANTLMTEFRTKQKLRVNVVQVSGYSEESAQYQSPNTHFGPELGFVGYVSDMLTAPPPIKNYLCKLYGLHKVPVFANKAEKHVDKLVNEFKIQKFFVGTTKYNCIRSKYSNNLSTTSNKIQGKKWLQVSQDKVRIRQVENELHKLEGQHETIHDRIRENNAKQKTLQRDLEAKRQENRNLVNRINHKKTLKTKWMVKEREKEKFIRETPPVDVDEIKRKIAVEKRRKFREMMRIGTEVAELVIKGTKHRMNMQRLKLTMLPVLETIDALRREQGERERPLEADKIRLGEEKQNVKIVTDRYREKLSAAQEATDKSGRFKGDSAPEELKAIFAQSGIEKIGIDECRIRIQEFGGQLQCMDNVNPDIVKEFTTLRDQKESLEREIGNAAEDLENRQGEMNAVKERWLTALTELVGDISQGFSGFFNSMGFAGEVRLGHGNDTNDFKNYGIEILVKFRDNVRLQQLDPYQQSGGERSVSTALYMMALQHLTKVPFRCVDEINQGMDAKNERRVFDMLIETAVRKNSAQYFLLTPKLLPDLQYDRGVTVLIVYNGDDMCDYHNWSNDHFVQSETLMSQQLQTPARA